MVKRKMGVDCNTPLPAHPASSVLPGLAERQATLASNS